MFLAFKMSVCLTGPPLSPLDGWLIIDVPVSDEPNTKRVSIRKRRAGHDSGIDVMSVRLIRIRVPVAVEDPAAEVSVETLVPPERHGHVLDAAVVDRRRRGRPYRYMYGKCIVGARPRNFCDAVCRVDVGDGSVVTWCEAPALLPAGPPTFIPRPGAAEEDETDGVLLVDCQGADGHAAFVILDAASFTEVARVVLPYRHCWAYRNAWVQT